MPNCVKGKGNNINNNSKNLKTNKDKKKFPKKEINNSITEKKLYNIESYLNDPNSLVYYFLSINYPDLLKRKTNRNKDKSKKIDSKKKNNNLKIGNKGKDKAIINKIKIKEKTEEEKNNKSNESTDTLLTQDTSINFSLISKPNMPKDIIQLPNNPKGLYNFSLNCYMNSLLQCFYHIKGLRSSFIDPSKYSSDDQKVCHSLSEVMKGLTYGEKSYYSPNTFKQALGDINSLFSGHKGADVSDLYRTVIDSILDEIPYENPEDEDYEDKRQNYEEAKKEVNPDNPVNKELNYFYETIYKCPKGYNIYTIQNDSSIMFELLKISKWTNEKIDLYKCFDYNFRVIQNNQFYCSKCECTHTNTSEDKLLSLPKVLTIILNRGKGKQFLDKVEFYQEINIQKYVDDTFIKPKKKKFKYKLIGISTHSGSSSSYAGHYIAYCYRDIEDKYYCFNDTKATPVEFDDIKNRGEPYILFYEQMDEITNEHK